MIITMTPYFNDFKLFKKVINQGIDSYLQAFTKSKFNYDKTENRYIFDFHESEVCILVRRLKEIDTNDSNQWAEDILNENVQ